MGREVGRLDWWNIPGEHTPTEWAAQVAAAWVIPLRDERDDKRAALNTLAVVQSNCKPLSESVFQDIFKRLTTYSDPMPERILSPAETKSLLGGR